MKWGTLGPILTAWLCLGLFLAAPGPVHAEKKDGDATALEAERAARRTELESLKELLAGERARLGRTRREERSVLDLLEEAELALEKLERERREIEQSIGQLGKSIAQTREGLAAGRTHLAAQRKSLGRRLVGLYKLGPAGSARVLLNASSVSDFQRRRHHLGLVLDQDAQRVEEFRRTVGELEALEASLERQRGELAQRELALKTNRERAIVERDNRLRIVRAVQRQRANHEQAVAELAGQSEELEKLIDLIERRIKSQVLLGPAGAGAGELEFASFQGSLLPPVSGEAITRFGRHVNERFGTVTFNNGIEIAAKAGTPIKAVFGGVVIFADRFKGYGNLIIVNHGGNYYSLYAHCERLAKEVGDPVEIREVIAWVGESGSLKGPTCYFEIRRSGEAQDPAQWLLME